MSDTAHTSASPGNAPSTPAVPSVAPAPAVLPDAAGAGAPPVVAVPGRREVRESTRQLFVRAAEAQRALIAAAEQGDLDMTGGDGDPGVRRPSAADREHDDAGAVAVRTAAAAGSASTAPPAAPRAEQPAAPASPPAPSLDPVHVAQQERLNLRAAELERREAEYQAKLAATPDVTQFRDKYHANPAGALRELVKAWTGAETDDEVKSELADLVTELSTEVLGLEVNDPQLRTHRETKKALRAVKAHKAELAGLKAKQAAEAEAQKQAADKQQAKSALAAVFPTAATKFPFLAAEDAPQELIFDVLESEHKATGIVLDWQEAARRADEFLKQQASAWFAKRKSILAPEQAQPTPSAKPAPLPEARIDTTPQGDPQGHRRSGDVQTQGMGRWDRQAHRRATLAKYGPSLRVKE